MKNATYKQNKNKFKKIFICLIILIFMIIVIIAIFKSFSKDKLHGTWTIDTVTMYEFDGKGNGKLILPSHEYKFIYKILNNEIFIDFENEGSKDSNYQFSVNDTVLTFTGINGTTGIYNLTKKEQTK